MEMTLGSQGLEWGDVATWLSAVASLIAVWIALGLARRAERIRRDEDRAMAMALAEAFSDELRAIHYRLEKLIALPEAENTADGYRRYKTAIGGLVSPVFDAHSESIRHYGMDEAKRIYLAYGAIARVKLLAERNGPIGDLTEVNMFAFGKYLESVPKIATPVLKKVADATYAVWSYTEHKDKDPFVDDV